jgi:hypothetical protein
VLEQRPPNRLAEHGRRRDRVRAANYVRIAVSVLGHRRSLYRMSLLVKDLTGVRHHANNSVR